MFAVNESDRGSGITETYICMSWISSSASKLRLDQPIAAHTPWRWKRLSCLVLPASSLFVVSFYCILYDILTRDELMEPREWL